MPLAFFMPTLVFGAQFNPYPVVLQVKGVPKTVITNRPALLSYTQQRAPQAARVVIVEPPRSERQRYYVYDPFALRFGSYPVLVESNHRVVYLTSQQAAQWQLNHLIGPEEFYTLDFARRKLIYQFGGRRLLPPNAPPVVDSPVPDQTATLGSPYTYTIPLTTFADPDDDSLSLVWSVKKADGSALPVQGVNFNPVTRVLSGTPTGSAGTVGLRVTGTDPYGRSVTDSFNLTISA